MGARVRITCLVDNSVLVGSNCWGEDSLSILVETSSTRILFDTGCDPQVLQHNAAVLDRDLSRTKHIVLSHGHHNHNGALEWLLTQNREPMIIADPEVFLKKLRRHEKEMTPVGMKITKEQLEGKATLQLSENVYPIAPGIVVSSRIPRVTPYEAPLEANLYLKGELMDVDSFNDDRALVLNLDKGLVVIVGCAHAGLVNTLTYAFRTFGKPIAALIGGTHLSEYPMERVSKTLLAIREKFKIQEFYLIIAPAPMHISPSATQSAAMSRLSRRGL